MIFQKKYAKIVQISIIYIIKFKEKIMANIKSAKKRISTIQRRREENKYVKATISTLIKKFRKMLEEGKVDEAENYSKEVYAYIDSACSKGVIHKNNASRKVGRLAETLYKAKATAVESKKETKPAKVEEKKEEVKVEEKKPAKKTTTKKATAEKAEAKTEEKATKKTTTKKTVAKTETKEEKKPVEKKTTAKKATKKAE